MAITSMQIRLVKHAKVHVKHVLDLQTNALAALLIHIECCMVAHASPLALSFTKITTKSED
jgi:hypothetical protein